MTVKSQVSLLSGKRPVETSVNCSPKSIESMTVVPSVSKRITDSPPSDSFALICKGPSSGSLSNQTNINPPAGIVVISGKPVGIALASSPSENVMPARSTASSLGLYISTQSANSPLVSAIVVSLLAINSLMTNAGVIIAGNSKAPSSIHSATRETCAAVRSGLLPGGISPLFTLCHNRLFA